MYKLDILCFLGGGMSREDSPEDGLGAHFNTISIKTRNTFLYGAQRQGIRGPDAHHRHIYLTLQMTMNCFENVQ